MLVLLAACTQEAPDTGDTAAATTAPPAVHWEAAFDTSLAGSLSGVWGPAPDDVYIVGGDESGGQAWHYDGAGWAPVTLPADTPLLVWAYGFGADDIWIVGEEGTALHGGASGWTPVDTGTTEDLWGVWGAAPDDVWVVGGDWGSGEPVILHWDGAGFAMQTLPAEENPRSATALFKVWGTGSTVFAVGERGLIVQLQADGSWKHVDGGPDADDDFVSLWGTSEDHIVAVGGRNTPRIATWDGTAWTTDKPSPSEVKPLNAVFMGSPEEAVIGGIYGFTATYDSTTGTVTPDPVLTTIAIHAIWGDGAGRHYAVGGTFAEPHEGVALVRTVE